MAADRSIHEISVEMANLVHESAEDPEAAHARADDLLIEAIRWLAIGEGRAVENEVANIIGNWRQIEKWYA